MPATGQITVSAPYTKRTPWFTQTDFNVRQNIKLGESKALAFDATFTNFLNQRNVVSNNQEIDSGYTSNYITPTSAGCEAYNIANYQFDSTSCFLPDGPSFYTAVKSKYDYVAAMNSSPLGTTAGGPITVSSQYGKPYLYQQSRNIRLGTALHLLT